MSRGEEDFHKLSKLKENSAMRRLEVNEVSPANYQNKLSKKRLEECGVCPAIRWWEDRHVAAAGARDFAETGIRWIFSKLSQILSAQSDKKLLSCATGERDPAVLKSYDQILGQGVSSCGRNGRCVLQRGVGWLDELWGGDKPDLAVFTWDCLLFPQSCETSTSSSLEVAFPPLCRLSGDFRNGRNIPQDVGTFSS